MSVMPWNFEGSQQFPVSVTEEGIAGVIPVEGQILFFTVRNGEPTGEFVIVGPEEALKVVEDMGLQQLDKETEWNINDNQGGET